MNGPGWYAESHSASPHREKSGHSTESERERGGGRERESKRRTGNEDSVTQRDKTMLKKKKLHLPPALIQEKHSHLVLWEKRGQDMLRMTQSDLLAAGDRQSTCS